MNDKNSLTATEQAIRERLKEDYTSYSSKLGDAYNALAENLGQRYVGNNTDIGSAIGGAISGNYTVDKHNAIGIGPNQGYGVGDYTYRETNPWVTTPWNPPVQPNQPPGILPGYNPPYQQAWPQMSPEDQAEHFKRMMDEMGNAAKVLPRNKFGAVLYQKECEYCTEHKEDWFDCDLCKERCADRVQHISMEKKTWTNHPDHNCKKAKARLNLILNAIVA